MHVKINCMFISRLTFQWSMCLILCQCHAVLITVASMYILMSDSVMASALFFLLKIAEGAHNL